MFNRFIELGKRYGLSPTEWMVEFNRDTGQVLTTGGDGEAYEAMMKALGVEPDSNIISHDILETVGLVDVIDEAIRLAPRKWAAR